MFYILDKVSLLHAGLGEQDLHRGCDHDVQEQQRPMQKVMQAATQEPNCGTLVGYVDDGACSLAHSDPAILSQELSRKYSSLEIWMKSNKLVINPDKTHLMIMGPKKIAAKRKEVSIQAGAFRIYPTESEKLLGGHLHQSRQWNKHIRDDKGSLVSRLTKRSIGLKKISTT